MSNFTPMVPFELEFEGDKVTMKLSRLRNEHLRELTGYIDIARNMEGDAIDVSFKDQIEMLCVAAKVLPAYVRDFKGLIIEGREARFDEVVDQVYFAELIGNIFSKLLSISFLKKDEAKKSEEPFAESPG